MYTCRGCSRCVCVYVCIIFSRLGERTGTPVVSIIAYRCAATRPREMPLPLLCEAIFEAPTELRAHFVSILPRQGFLWALFIFNRLREGEPISLSRMFVCLFVCSRIVEQKVTMTSKSGENDEIVAEKCVPRSSSRRRGFVFCLDNSRAGVRSVGVLCCVTRRVF